VVSLAGGGPIAVVAPHPDDETLGCGGTIGRAVRDGVRVHWIVVTEMSAAAGYGAERMASRAAEIEAVARHYGFASVERLGFPPAGLTQADLPRLVPQLGAALDRAAAETVLAPSPSDAHSDHAVVFAAVNAASKAFRRPRIRRLFVYETLSETGYNLDPAAAVFRPNAYVRLTEADLAAKLAAMALYAGETAAFPFPRSAEAIRALAALRGSECDAIAAEAYQALRVIL